jgi:hypothetical protein
LARRHLPKKTGRYAIERLEHRMMLTASGTAASYQVNGYASLEQIGNYLIFCPSPTAPGPTATVVNLVTETSAHYAISAYSTILTTGDSIVFCPSTAAGGTVTGIDVVTGTRTSTPIGAYTATQTLGNDILFIPTNGTATRIDLPTSAVNTYSVSPWQSQAIVGDWAVLYPSTIGGSVRTFDLVDGTPKSYTIGSYSATQVVGNNIVFSPAAAGGTAYKVDVNGMTVNSYPIPTWNSSTVAGNYFVFCPAVTGGTAAAIDLVGGNAAFYGIGSYFNAQSVGNVILFTGPQAGGGSTVEIDLSTRVSYSFQTFKWQASLFIGNDIVLYPTTTGSSATAIDYVGKTSKSYDVAPTSNAYVLGNDLMLIPDSGGTSYEIDLTTNTESQYAASGRYQPFGNSVIIASSAPNGSNAVVVDLIAKTHKNYFIQEFYDELITGDGVVFYPAPAIGGAATAIDVVLGTSFNATIGTYSSIQNLGNVVLFASSGAGTAYRIDLSASSGPMNFAISNSVSNAIIGTRVVFYPPTTGGTATAVSMVVNSAQNYTIPAYSTTQSDGDDVLFIPAKTGGTAKRVDLVARTITSYTISNWIDDSIIGDTVLFSPSSAGGTATSVNLLTGSSQNFTIGANGGSIVASNSVVFAPTSIAGGTVMQINLTLGQLRSYTITGFETVQVIGNDVVFCPQSSGSAKAIDVVANVLKTYPVGTFGGIMTFGNDLMFMPGPLGTATEINFTTVTSTIVTGGTAGAVYGNAQTFTATVSPMGALETGTMQFVLDGVNFGSPVALSGNTATLVTSALTAGNHTISASYSGDFSFAGNSSASLPQTVAKAMPTLSWANPASIAYGTGLDAAQLNATASAPGTFSYTPGVGTILNPGLQQLSTTFTPTDSTDYNGAAGNAAVMVNIVVGAGQTISLPGSGQVFAVQQLTLGTGATLNLGDDTLIVDYTGTSPMPAIRSWLASGFNAGAWNGIGIDSSAAALNPERALGYAEASDLGITAFLGQSVDSTAVVVRYTKYGDNNLDGNIDIGNDFNLFLDGVNNRGSTWLQGDYTYDGKADLGNDFNLFMRNYLSQATPAAAAPSVLPATTVAAAAMPFSVKPMTMGLDWSRNNSDLFA